MRAEGGSLVGQVVCSLQEFYMAGQCRKINVWDVHRNIGCVNEQIQKNYSPCLHNDSEEALSILDMTSVSNSALQPEGLLHLCIRVT